MYRIVIMNEQDAANQCFFFLYQPTNSQKLHYTTSSFFLFMCVTDANTY